MYVGIFDKPESGSIEVSPNITAELNEKGDLIDIAILNVRTFIRDSILELVQVKMLKIFSLQAA